jgi:hypothetical protein
VTEPKARGVQLNRGVEQVDSPARERGPQLESLDAWVGRGINEGDTVNADGSPGLRITTSDVYEWAPGGFFVVHTAYGRVGEFGGGAIEILGYDDTSGDHNVQTVLHERTDNGTTYAPSMGVRLVKVD